MVDNRQSEVRRARKESLLFRELSSFLMRITQNDSLLAGIFVSAVVLSPDKSSCSILFASANGKAYFEEHLGRLILYKPALRKALSQAIQARHTPQLIFKYDERFEKEQKLNTLFDQLKVEGKL
jgi:ribosome-binding factor A